jgi:dipeptidyl aminopeptidase/acylaminoacyl peptidase
MLLGFLALALLALGCVSSSKRASDDLLVLRVTTAAGGPRYDLVLVRATGHVVRVVVGESRRPALRPAIPRGGSWAPDGRRFAFTLDRGGGHDKLSRRTDIYVADANGSRLRRLTRSGAAFAPVWAPNGSAIVYAQRKPDDNLPFRSSLWIMRSDGSGKRRLLPARHGQINIPGSWSADGRLVALTRARWTAQDSILTVRPDGTGLRTLVANAASPAYSPDGRRLAYVSDRAYGDEAFFDEELYVSDAERKPPTADHAHARPEGRLPRLVAGRPAARVPARPPDRSRHGERGADRRCPRRVGTARPLRPDVSYTVGAPRLAPVTRSGPEGDPPPVTCANQSRLRAARRDQPLRENPSSGR